jgi:hypothetical protein
MILRRQVDLISIASFRDRDTCCSRQKCAQRKTALVRSPAEFLSWQAGAGSFILAGSGRSAIKLGDDFPGEQPGWAPFPTFGAFLIVVEL